MICIRQHNHPVWSLGAIIILLFQYFSHSELSTLRVSHHCTHCIILHCLPLLCIVVSYLLMVVALVMNNFSSWCHVISCVITPSATFIKVLFSTSLLHSAPLITFHAKSTSRHEIVQAVPNLATLAQFFYSLLIKRRKLPSHINADVCVIYFEYSHHYNSLMQ